VPEDPFKRPGAQPDRQIFEDLDGGLQLLKADPRVKGQPIFAWGYCLGGRFALLWPTYQPEITAAAAFHGFPTNDTGNPNTPTEPAGRVEHLRIPVIACFGESDRLVAMTEVERFRREVLKHKKPVEIHTYPGADHGWTNPKAPAYRQEAAEDCWRRATQFLKGCVAERRRAAS
jgi:carboxymethylenebutenolidase